MSTQPKRPLAALFARAMAQRALISCLSVAIGLPLGLCCIFGILLLVNQTAGTGAEVPILVGIAVVGGLFAVAMPIGTVAFFGLRRARKWDAVFEPLGLTGRPFALQWRQYEGQIGGRDARLRFWRGPRLEIMLSGEVSTRMAIGTRTALGQTLAPALGEQIAIEDPDLAHLAASGRDADWARALLDDAGARAAILRLTQDASATEVRSLVFEPGAARLLVSFMPMSFLTTENARALVDDLQAVLAVAERLPPPAEPV